MRQGTRLIAGVVTVVALGGAAVAAGVALLLANIVHLRANADATLRTGSYLESTVDLERVVIDAETGLRGYVITGQPLFLAPERTASEQLPAASSSLESAAMSNGAFLAQARSLIGSARSYMISYVPRVIGQVRTDPAAARSFATTAEGKRLVDGIRGRTARLEQLISARQASRLRSAHRSANAAVTVGIVVLIVLTALTVALASVLGWLLVGRERARERAEALYRASEHTALELQQSLLPAQLPDVPSCELAIRFAPAGAGELVGGDFYDVFAVGDDRWAVVIGDVCGKGPRAAAVTAMARWTLRSRAGEARPPAEALRALNDAMLRLDLGGRFITMVYGLLDTSGPQARITVASAGHPPAVLVPHDGEPVPVEARGDLLGVWPDIRVHEVEVPLRAGDGLVMYTDGVVDEGPARPAPERSPEQALRSLSPGWNADALADAVLHEAGPAASVRRDDIAIVALRYVPPVRAVGAPSLTYAPAGA
jgi:CHASE3 domain sensor protein